MFFLIQQGCLCSGRIQIEEIFGSRESVLSDDFIVCDDVEHISKHFLNSSSRMLSKICIVILTAFRR